MNDYLKELVLDFQIPIVMGIVNTTPDSFSDGGNFSTFQNAVEQCLRLLDEGADIIDIGGESTRPGSDPVDEIEELKRTIPLITTLITLRPLCKISIDTTKAEVAKRALNAGAVLVNDVSAFRKEEEKMSRILQEFDPFVCVMHMKGIPKSMQKAPVYDNLENEVYTFLEDRIKFVQSLGLNKIIADVGIGFGKSLEHNVTLMKNLHYFSTLNVPLLLGISRKNFLGALTDISDPKERDIATIITHTLLVSQPISIIRSHSVHWVQQLKKLSSVFTS